MDWLFNPERNTIIVMLVAFLLSAGLAIFRRKMEWSGAAVLAAFIVSMVFFVLGCIRYGFGPLFLIGWGMLFIPGVAVALPTVAVLRGVLALLDRSRAKG